MSAARARAGAFRGVDDELARVATAAFDLGDTIECALVHDLGVDRDDVRRRARDLSELLARNLAGARDLDLDLASDLGSVLDLAGLLDPDLDPGPGGDLGGSWARARGDTARDLTRDVVVALAVVAADVRARVNGARGAMTPAGPAAPVAAAAATRVLRHAVRMLPGGARDRYREELAAELADLAAAGTSRRGQLAFTLRLAGRMWSVRCALRAAVPGRRRAR